MTISVILACFARGSVTVELSTGSIVTKQLADSMVLLFLKSKGCFYVFMSALISYLHFRDCQQGCVVV